LLLAAAKLLYTFAQLKVRLEQDTGRNRSVLHLEGAATFIRLPKLAGALELVPAITELHVNVDGLTYIDHACLDLLITWERQHEATGGRLVIDWNHLTARFDGRAPRRKHRSRSVSVVTPSHLIPGGAAVPVEAR
jgi:hypothetical protein